MLCFVYFPETLNIVAANILIYNRLECQTHKSKRTELKKKTLSARIFHHICIQSVRYLGTLLRSKSLIFLFVCSFGYQIYFSHRITVK